MATGSGVEDVGGPIRRLFGDGSASGMDEGELLRRFAVERDSLALEVLASRHGPMVLGVCRRVLGNRHSAEDAFQATFLVLAKRAGSIRDPDRLGPWLHGVAHRVALRSRAQSARRNARERTGGEEATMATSADDGPEFDRFELRAALDEEVRSLPEKFRDPIILCYLDGLTHDEAAVRLRCPVGTVRSRLSAGRSKLRERLSRRGVTVPSGVFAAVLAAESASAAVSTPLLVSTVKAATAFAGGLAGATTLGMVPAEVASLAEGVVKTMIISKLKIVGGAALAGLLTLGSGVVTAHQFGAQGGAAKVEKPADEPIEKLKERADKAEAREKALKAELDAVKAELAAARDARPPGVTEIKKDASPTMSEMMGRGGMGMGGSGTGVGRMGGGMGMGGSGVDARMMGGGMGGGGMMGGRTVGPGGGIGGVGQMMGGGKTLTTLQTEDCVVVYKPKGETVSAYSTETGEWASYAVPKTLEVVPVASANVVALMSKGERIAQIATFVPKAGQWYPTDLKEPTQGQAAPIVSSTLAVYTIGRRVYAFSAQARAWDVVELPEGAKPQAIVASNRATVEHGDHLYIFSAKTGKWADFDANAGQLATPGAK